MVARAATARKHLSHFRRHPTLSVPRRAQVIIVDFEARVIHPDIEASNGVIHTIDRVLLPRGGKEEEKEEEEKEF